MVRQLGMAIFCASLFGCALKLPEIPETHPANAAAPAGQAYAAPAVLEVKPLERPPDRPMTRPAHPWSHESEGMTPMGEMPDRHEESATAHEHAGLVDPTETLPAPTDKNQHDSMEGKGQQRMQREGQLHE